jgi:DNA polymerase-3 subunit epsilon
MSTETKAKPIIVAIDFETANYEASSACQLGLVRLEGWEIKAKQSWLIRPPSDEFVFSYLHGITWEHVEGYPDLAGHWAEIEPLLQDADFLAAHNAPFDRGVLEATCRIHGLQSPQKPYIDTVQVARKTWQIFPTKLNLVCERLGISLKHHEALSDALACAEILIQAHAEGWQPR